MAIVRRVRATTLRHCSSTTLGKSIGLMAGDAKGTDRTAGTLHDRSLYCGIMLHANLDPARPMSCVGTRNDKYSPKVVFVVIEALHRAFAERDGSGAIIRLKRRADRKRSTLFQPQALYSQRTVLHLLKTTARFATCMTSSK